MTNDEMTAKIQQGDGFIAALDQSGGSTPKALQGYGIDEGAWSSDEEMFDLIHQMRERIITAPCFGSGKGIGAILFERAKSLGVFGTKERSVINAANAAGIAVLVAQQFQLAKQVLAHGLMPIVEPEVNIKSADRAVSDDLLLTAILEGLDEVPDGQQVMLKLSIPAEPGKFDQLVLHPKVL